MTPLLSIEDAAAYLNIPARSVSDHVRAGEIRHVRLGKHVRMRPEWLDEFIASCERPVIASVSIQRGRRRAKL